MSTLPPTQCDCCAQSPPEVLRSHARGGILVCLRCHLNEGECCWVYPGGSHEQPHRYVLDIERDILSPVP